MKITALTSCCVDLYPETGEVYVGGNSLNFATQCHRLGAQDISVIGAVGDDVHGTLIEAHLTKYDINHHHVYRSAAATASNRIYIDEKGDRYFKADSWNGGAFDLFRLNDEDWAQLKQSDIVAMPAGDPNLQELLRKRSDQLLIVDFLDYLGIEFLEKHIELVDVACISTSTSELERLADISAHSGKMILATLGAQGSWAYYNGSSYFQEALEVHEIVDTTGCGDAFQAAFIIDWYQHKQIETAMFKGAEAAQFTLGFKGGALSEIPN